MGKVNLKTLKDIELSTATRYRIKAQAIKWVKEDIEDICCHEPISLQELETKWMERLNITESDLEETNGI